MCVFVQVHVRVMCVSVHPLQFLKHSITMKYYHNGTINHILVDIRDTVSYRDHETVSTYV